MFQQYDGAGIVTNSKYDCKGNLLSSSRQLIEDYKDPVDWSQSQLPGDLFVTSSTFDALNRPVTMVAPDASVITPTYNQATQLVQLAVNLRGAANATSFVTNIDYNAKGQRILIAYGNGASTQYEYDQQTFRMTHLYTSRGSAFPGDGTNPDTPPVGVQNLRYTFDPVGNITHIQDDAQQTIFFNNQIVEPSNDYTYDALYRLIEAHGRELIGLVEQPQTTFDDTPRMAAAASARRGCAGDAHLHRGVPI